LFSALYAGLRQMSVKLIDSLEQLGGQLTTLYPEKYIYDVPGFPKILAKDLAAGLITQAMQARPTLALGERVGNLLFDSDGSHYVITTDKAEHCARAVLIAAGVGAIEPKRLALSAAERFEGKGLHYFVRDAEAFRGRRVLIVGGGDNAVDWANTLWPITKSLTLIHVRDVFRAHESCVELLRSSPADVRPFHELNDLGGQGRVEEAVIFDTRAKRTQTLSVDAVLINIGFESSLGPIRHWGIELDRSAIRVDPTMRTSRPGVFAAGDVVTYPGKLKLIATAFGEAATAVNHAKRYLDPAANLFPGHSTSVAEQRLSHPVR
jgi:thioredoxin reductase (NADPH)